jgi:hypothetical protein
MNQNKIKKFAPYLNLNQKNQIGIEHRKSHFILGVDGKLNLKIIQLN